MKSTKAACIKVLKAIHPECELVDDSGPFTYDVTLDAPPFYSWGSQCHLRVVNWYNSNNKAEFWAEVLEQINELPPLVSCLPTCDVEGQNLICEYWGPGEQ